MPAVSVLGRQRQEDWEFRPTLDCIAGLCQNHDDDDDDNNNNCLITVLQLGIGTLNPEIVRKRHLNDTFRFIHLFFKNLTILPKEPIGLSWVFFLGNSPGVRNIRKWENKTVTLCFWLSEGWSRSLAVGVFRSKVAVLPCISSAFLLRRSISCKQSWQVTSWKQEWSTAVWGSATTASPWTPSSPWRNCPSPMCVHWLSG